MNDSSAWDSTSSPLQATTCAGRVSVQSGSTSASVGRSAGEAMPVFASIDSRSKMAMPVTSLPVPEVVGQAMCGASGPGTGVPAPTGALTYARKSAGMGGVEVGRLRGVDHRSAAHGDIAVRPGFQRESRCRLEGFIGGFDVDIGVDDHVETRRAQRALRGLEDLQPRHVGIGEQRHPGHAERRGPVTEFG